MNVAEQKQPAPHKTESRAHRKITKWISHYPCEHRRALSNFVAGYAQAADLLETNPPLAVCIAVAETWDSLHGSRLGVNELIAQRRRQICAALGFPGTEAVVRILSKVTPEACNIALLMRMRRRLNNEHLLKILAHIEQNWRSGTSADHPMGTFSSHVGPTLFGTRYERQPGVAKFVSGYRIDDRTER